MFSKFQRSQAAHLRLNSKHFSLNGSDKSRCLSNYHADCYDTQKRLDRILTKTERKQLFDYYYADEICNKKIKYPVFKEKGTVKK